MTPPTATEVRALAEKIRAYENMDAFRDRETFGAIFHALRAYAMLLEQTCEGCKFAYEIDKQMGMTTCKHPQMRRAAYFGTCWVPLVINGNPFSCAGWTTKEEK